MANQEAMSRTGPRVAGSGKGGQDMVRLIKGLLVLGVLGFAGLTVYAYVADLTPAQSQVTVPVTLNAD